MNWKEIDKKHPKAYRKLCTWKIEHFFSLEDDDRNLYDFFDENEICITTPNADCLDKWCTYIWSKNIGGIMSPYKYSNRTEAEQAAFIKAFEILEEKLK